VSRICGRRKLEFNDLACETEGMIGLEMEIAAIGGED